MAANDDDSMDFDNDGYVPYPLAYVIVGSMMLVICIAMIVFSVYLGVVCRRAKKEQQKELRAYKDTVAQLKIQNAQRHPMPPSSAYVVTPQQKLQKIQQDKLADLQNIETRAVDLASVVSYLAENPVKDEDIEFRPAHRSVLLVKQQLADAADNKENRKRAADSNV